MIWIGLTALAAAAQMDLSPAQLCALADLVAAVEITTLEARWSDAPAGGIETRADALALEVLAGEGTEDLEIVLPGGAIGDAAQWVEDTPRLSVDTRYLVFLKALPDGGWAVIGGEGGARRLAAPGERRGQALEELRESLEACR